MKVTILGKYGPYGKAGEGATSGYLVQDNGFNFLLDMGSGVLPRLIANVSVKDLDGIFISHLHYDHTSDLLPFRYLLEETQTKIKIYTEKQNSKWYEILFEHPLFEVININEKTEIEIKGKRLTFYRMKHPSPDLGIKIEGNGIIGYTGDTQYNENIKELLNGCDIAIADCSKPERFIGGHMTVADARCLKQECTVKKLIASHASPDYNPSEDFNGIGGIVFAEERQIYYT